MTKIVVAVNVMIENARKIKPVLRGEENLLFFVYDGRHKWGIRLISGDAVLAFYPGNESIEELASTPAWDWDDIQVVIYKATEIGGREALQTFQDLHRILTEKLFGVDKVLDDIIDKG
jgi:hypothetical protein